MIFKIFNAIIRILCAKFRYVDQSDSLLLTVQVLWTHHQGDSKYVWYELPFKRLQVQRMAGLSAKAIVASMYFGFDRKKLPVTLMMLPPTTEAALGKMLLMP